MSKDIRQIIADEVFEDIWDMNLNQLKDFHLAFVLNTFHSMQQITKQDISNEFIIKHFELAKKFNKVLNLNYYKKSKKKFKND